MALDAVGVRGAEVEGALVNYEGWEDALNCLYCGKPVAIFGYWDVREQCYKWVDQRAHRECERSK